MVNLTLTLYHLRNGRLPKRWTVHINMYSGHWNLYNYRWTFAHTHEFPTRFTTHYPTKKGVTTNMYDFPLVTDQYTPNAVTRSLCS